jgi:hypothetical protein
VRRRSFKMAIDPRLAYLSGMLGQEKKKPFSHYEGAIPLIILLFLVVFALGKVGIIDLTWIPGVGDLFTPPETKVLVISNSTSLCTGPLNPDAPLLCWFRISTESKALNIVSEEQQSADFWVIDPSYRIVFVTREIISNTLREKLVEYVSNGGNVVIIGRGASQVYRNQTLLVGVKDFPGWFEGGFDTFIPVDGEVVTNSSVSPLTFIKTNEEPSRLFFSSVPGLTAGVPFEIYSGFTNVFSVQERPGTDTLAFREVNPDIYEPVIVQKAYNRGKVLYLAWNPVHSTTQTILWAVIEYLDGG